MTQRKSREGSRRQLGGELLIPAMAVAFTIYYFTTIWNSPWTAQVSAFLVGGVLLAVCAAFVLRCALLLSQGGASLGFGNLVSRDDLRTGRVGLLLATLGFCVLIKPLGFTLTTFLFLCIAMAILSKGRRLGFIAAVSAGTALVGWAVFVWAFDTRFPRGLFETLMQVLLGNG